MGLLKPHSLDKLGSHATVCLFICVQYESKDVIEYP